jgi:6,7-dimethyl-8-ribityllumazine synthase
MNDSPRIVIVCARFNETVTNALLRGALATLKERGVPETQIEVVWVPGSFELPLAANAAAERTEVAAVVCLGAVIRGETPHFEYVSEAAAMGILRVGLDNHKPVTFGVLTTDNPEQAFQRAGGPVGNKGADAANAAMDMIETLQKIRSAGSPL